MSGPHPLPAELGPVLAFVNSMDVELGTDQWAEGPAALAAWMTGAGLLAAGVTVTADEFALAGRLRAGLREMTLANNGVPADGDDLAVVLRAFPLVVSPGAGTLAGTHDGPVMAGLGTVVAGYATGLLTGAWTRMRQCPAGDCAWVFWDSSAKGTRRWCTMRVCGNRAKARAFVERRRAADA
ncbi:CGNR zinc finger domain-containing protein [Actinoplanes awajinensis]|uniref:Zinc finger CGNR domain-containing protein n=1 Tax=Actinoplanes awajinensis subsp. mycoplanecinus TaxID=135947 RepID=A0A124G965_9ACTN|nr:CGNR zinc finger domain-containing protein [Actinoplanes awajinensis]KUL28030.1 hypothetical protein ADL15_33030 [Actinoplanes awajinensis subsp. mycoplanecinus]